MKSLTQKRKMLLTVKGKKIRRIVMKKKPEIPIFKPNDYSREVTLILKEITNINRNIKEMKFAIKVLASKIK